MAVRKIEYTVSADGISPSVKQFAGVQGEHKATKLVFNIHPTLYESLTEQLSDGGKLIYRCDGYDGEGGFCRSDTGELTGTQVTYPLEEWLTRFGGVVKVVLVISVLKDDLTEMELYSFPALLQLKNLPEGAETDGESYESMSVLAQVAKNSASIAVSSAEIATEARSKTELARATLENGTVWIFDGGDAEGNVDLNGDGESDYNTADVRFVVDGEMSDNSENAVKNKVIKGYVDENVKELDENVKELTDGLEDTNTALETLNDDYKGFKYGLADYIVEQGTSDTWTYRKWNSGVMECWGKCTQQLLINTLWSGTTDIYVSNEDSQEIINFPFEFTDIPNVTISASSTDYSVVLISFKTTGITQYEIGTPQVARPLSTGDTSVEVTFNFDVKGRWK